MENEGQGARRVKNILSFCKNIKKFSKVGERPPHLKPYCDSGSWEHCYTELTGSFIKFNVKISFVPADTQEHELKPTVRKTEVWTDQKKIFLFFNYKKRAANHTTVLLNGAQISN